MKKFCAWCKHYQREIEPIDNPAETHGICQSCYIKFMLKFYVKYYWDKVKGFFKKLFKGDPRKNQISWYVGKSKIVGYWSRNRYIKIMGRKEVSDDQRSKNGN